MSAINAINLSRFFLKFIPQDPDLGSALKCGSGSLYSKNADPDPRTQKNADPGSASLLLSKVL